MLDFILNALFWSLSLYGLIEILRNIYYIITYTKMKPNGIYMIIATKNQAGQIEGFLRNILFRLIYGKEEMIKEIIVADLGSSDETKQIVDKISNDYTYIKSINWKECKEIIENINQT